MLKRLVQDTVNTFTEVRFHIVHRDNNADTWPVIALHLVPLSALKSAVCPAEIQTLVNTTINDSLGFLIQAIPLQKRIP